MSAAGATLPAANAAAERQQAQREAILRTPGLGAAMLLIERRGAMPAAWLAECWRWVSWMQASRGLAVPTLIAYASTLGGFAEWIAQRGLDYTDVPIDALDDWQRYLFFDRRNKPGRRAYALTALRSFYDWRATRGLGRNCTEGTRSPRIAKRTPRKYTKQQLQHLFTACRKAGEGRTALVCQRDEALIALLYATGMRRGEVSSLRPDQIEMDEQIAVIRIEGKGAKEREVAIEGPALKLLRAWLAKRGELDGVMAETVFVTVRRNWWGRRMGPKAIERAVCSIAKRAGIGEWGVHRFRVTFATQLYDDRMDLERIRILLGHESIETTRRYLAVSGQQRRHRLKAFRQHEVMGTRPEGMPRWAQKLTGERLVHQG